LLLGDLFARRPGNDLHLAYWTTENRARLLSSCIALVGHAYGSHSLTDWLRLTPAGRNSAYATPQELLQNKRSK